MNAEEKTRYVNALVITVLGVVVARIKPSTREELQDLLSSIFHKVRSHPALAQYEATLDTDARSRN